MNPLVNVLTPKVRAVAYAALFVAAIAFAAWKASNGDWTEFVGGLITALLGATAASNASTTPAAETVTPTTPAPAVAVVKKRAAKKSAPPVD